MSNVYEKMMDVICVNLHEVLLCADKCKWLRKRTLNPIRKLQYYVDERRFRSHVFGIMLIKYKLEKAFEEES